MPAVLVVALRELRQRLRDRSALVLGFLAPLVLTGLINAAFHSSSSFHATVGYVDLDHGPVAASFSDVLTGPERAEHSPVPRTHRYCWPVPVA